MKEMGMQEQETPADLLRSGAGRVRVGWCTHRLVNAQGSVCAIGSMTVDAQKPWLSSQLSTSTVVTHSGAAVQSAVQVLARQIRLSDRMPFFGIDVDAVTWFNDHVAEDAEDVAVMMEKAAASWEETH